jgi:hypothetical protein
VQGCGLAALEQGATVQTVRKREKEKRKRKKEK